MLTVTVRDGKKAQRFTMIVAIGIGHRHEDLVLVQRKPGDQERVIEIGPAEYTSVTVTRKRKR